VKFVFELLDGFLRPWIAQVWRPLPGVGLTVLLLLVLAVGVVVRSFVGHRIIHLYESVLNRLPFARSVYAGAKQLVEALSAGGGRSFRSVVLVEFPRDGCYALGFVTCDGMGEVQLKTPGTVTNVFVPTTPNPTSGFLILVPKQTLIPLSMTVEEAIKLIVSGGLVAPPVRDLSLAPERVALGEGVRE